MFRPYVEKFMKNDDSGNHVLVVQGMSRRYHGHVRRTLKVLKCTCDVSKTFQKFCQNHNSRAVSVHALRLIHRRALQASRHIPVGHLGPGCNRPKKVPPGIVPRCGHQPRERSPVRHCDLQGRPRNWSRRRNRSGRTRSRRSCRQDCSPVRYRKVRLQRPPSG